MSPSRRVSAISGARPPEVGFVLPELSGYWLKEIEPTAFDGEPSASNRTMFADRYET